MPTVTGITLLHVSRVLFQQSYPTMLRSRRVRVSGVYEIVHQGHRAPHQGFLCKGDRLPNCQRCGDNAIFRLIHPTKEPNCEHISADGDFMRGVMEV